MTDYFSSLSRQLARIRCFEEFIRTIGEKRLLPESMCYTPSYECFEICSKSLTSNGDSGVSLDFRDKPSYNSLPVFDGIKKIYDVATLLLCSRRIHVDPEGQITLLHVNGDSKMEVKDTIWLEIVGFWRRNSLKPKTFDKPIYLFWHNITTSRPPSSAADHKLSTEMDEIVRPLRSKTIIRGNDRLGEAGGCIYVIDRWEEVVELSFGVTLVGDTLSRHITPADAQIVTSMRALPSTGWDHRHDEALVRFIVETGKTSDERGGKAGTVWTHVEQIELSSSIDHTDDAIAALTDDNPSTYWESDGNQSSHYIRLYMKKNTAIEKLYLTIDTADDSYLPHKICVLAGENEPCFPSEMRKLSEMELDIDRSGDICVYEAEEGTACPFALVEIQILECKDEGIDVRIRGLKIKTKHDVDPTSELNFQIDERMFKESPGLVLADADSLAIKWRAVALKRAASLLDSVLPMLVPKCQLLNSGAVKDDVFEYSPFPDLLKRVLFLLPLSHKRQSIFDHFLKETESRAIETCPKLFINRHLARGDCTDPNVCIFNQIYDGLILAGHQQDLRLNYRWSPKYEQWWECKFIGEGVIDQGGGFRDSLCDIGEELCPSDPDTKSSLPYFVPAPNQQGDEHNRDTFVINHGCRDFGKYEWIGQLLGACLRTKEHLILPLSKFTWKQILGQPVSWTEDFTSVDRTLVRLTDKMLSMSREEFEQYFGDKDSNHGTTLTTTLCNGDVIDLIPGGSTVPLQYENKDEYVERLKDCRLKEGLEQAKAIRRGLLRVIPSAALTLLTWYELERRVSGDPEVSLEALKKAARYEDLESTEPRVQYLWEALKNFSNEERSKFLRFVTGRRRLPTPLYIVTDKNSNEGMFLPETSTCSNTLFLPDYPSAQVCEEKLRYAINNCLAIDTDVSPWET